MPLSPAPAGHWRGRAGSARRTAQAGDFGAARPTTQLDGYRVELAELSGIKSAAGRTAALRRETELLRTQRGHDTETIADLQAERDAQQAELRRLSAAHAALDAELREQHNAHQQRLSDLQAARDELRAQFAELAGRIFDEREQRFSESSHERLGQLLEPLKERIQAFEKRVEESYQHEARERPGPRAGAAAAAEPASGRRSDQPDPSLQGQKTQGNWGELVLEKVLEHAGLEKGREYHTQVSLKSADGARFQPDVLIHLPGDKQVVVDAKVSLTAYQALTCAEDEGSRALALKQHVQSLRNHLGAFAQGLPASGGAAEPRFRTAVRTHRSGIRGGLQADPELSRRPTVGTS